MSKILTVKCPVCHKVGKWEGNPFRPFCSKRCRLLDLDGWLGERYRIPADESEESSESGAAEPIIEENHRKFS